jgi:hypothetical protein
MRNKKNISNIIKCNKWGFENGEKAKYSGCLNRWVIEKNVFYPNLIQEWVFLYYQPVRYNVEYLENSDTLTERQQILACIKAGYWEIPINAYGQRLTAWCISPIFCINCKNFIITEARLYMLSGDDDIIAIKFPIEDTEKVKSFISKNYKMLYYETLETFIEENNYIFI